MISVWNYYCVICSINDVVELITVAVMSLLENMMMIVFCIFLFNLNYEKYIYKFLTAIVGDRILENSILQIN